ncbi:MAG: alpha/beta hydrolase [Streptosporangiaceae bacterium]
MPAELAELAALYRSLLADRRMLVVLDDALTGALARALDEASAEDPEFGTQLRELWDRVGLRAAAGDQGIAGGPDRAARWPIATSRSPTPCSPSCTPACTCIPEGKTMPVARVNDIELNYKLEGEGEETIVLVNGLADDLETWVLQVDEFLAAGYRVLRFDNRGIGASAKPAGPYSSRMLADDAKALVDSLGIADFHLMGVSMGGMIAQEYAHAYPADLRSVTFACTYAAPGPFCSRMFAMWADMVPVLGVPFVMRDVTLWAFTLPFFEQRTAELEEFETAMRYLDQPVHAFLAQLAVIQEHDTTSRLGEITVPSLVLAGEEDILIPVALSHRIHEGIPGSEWATTKGGHGCVWEHPADFNRTYLDFVARHRKG